MNMFESFKAALASIAANKLRSFLTMLGIIIGISSVITIVSIGRGGKTAITGEFEKIGTNIMMIKLDNKSQKVRNEYFTMEDVEKIIERIPSVKNAAPNFQKSGLIKTERETKRAFIIATSEDLDSIENFEVLYGRFINDKDMLTGKNVILIDDISAKILFGYEDCTGKTVKIGSSVSMANATIIGVYRNVGGAFAEAFSDDMPVFVYMPITYAEKIFSNDFNINEIEVSLTDSGASEKAASGIVRLLETNHHNRGNYKAENMMKQLDKVDKILSIFTAVIGSIAGISLIVGGIGVMNIMLVSVTERTREIGIRKAIGATRKNILIQFLIEAVIIALIGGIIGMMLGILMGFAIGAILKITPGISLLTIITAFLFSSAVGIFFGLYPANKASKLDPIEALRYE